MNYNDYRRRTGAVRVGSVLIGGSSPITIQSMTNTDSHDIEGTYNQAIKLQMAGCDILRMTAPDVESIGTFSELKARGITIPLVADIHFDYKIAIRAVCAGVDKIRINPGNIGSRERIREVVLACKEYGVPIRIGVNSGSLEEHILKKYGAPTAEGLAESALYHADLLRELDFDNIILSVKSSNVQTMIGANRILAERTSYPLHLGVTEAGAREVALIKSSIGIGTLLAEGIGDTIRVSLTDDPTEEISAAKSILKALDMSDNPGMDIISCPTCGRTKIDLISLCREFEDAVKKNGLNNKDIKVALMGCAVNGPGEAREADIGVAGGNGEALLFKRGEIIRKIKEKDIVPELIREISLM